MKLQVQYSAATIRVALEEVIEALFGIPRAEIRLRSRRSLGEQAHETKDAIASDIITIHLLREIIQFALQDVTSHAEAIDTLQANQASLVHVRHIEEIFTVTKFILHDPSRYEEFSWRWKNYSAIHGIRNRLLNIKTALDPAMQSWISQNLPSLKKYVDKKFEMDSQKCIKSWEKYGNWLHPIALKEVFETTGRKDSYVSTEYDWNSHAVHFSPLANHYYGIELKQHTYAEFAIASVERYLHAFCRECLAVVKNRDKLRDLHARNIYLEIARMLEDKPQWYIDMANRGGRFAQLTEFLLSSDRKREGAVTVALGQEPEDPLLIKVSG